MPQNCRQCRDLRRKYWTCKARIVTKKLPCGTLKILFVPLKGQNNDTFTNCQHGLLVNFIFMPDSQLQWKHVSAAVLARNAATMSPLEFHHIRSFNSIISGGPVYRALLYDDVGSLQDLMSRRCVTPWDRRLEPSRPASIIEVRQLARAEEISTKFKCS